MIICPSCLTGVYSRARHDFRTCPCSLCFVDGGMDYMRYGYAETDENYNGVSKIISLKYPVKKTKQQIYDDYNQGTDKLGYIKLTKKKLKLIKLLYAKS